MSEEWEGEQWNAFNGLDSCMQMNLCVCFYLPQRESLAIFAYWITITVLCGRYRNINPMITICYVNGYDRLVWKDSYCLSVTDVSVSEKAAQLSHSKSTRKRQTQWRRDNENKLKTDKWVRENVWNKNT